MHMANEEQHVILCAMAATVGGALKEVRDEWVK